MSKKIVDLMNYKIEKTLKSYGLTIKTDKDKKVTLLFKIKPENQPTGR